MPPLPGFSIDGGGVCPRACLTAGPCRPSGLLRGITCGFRAWIREAGRLQRPRIVLRQSRKFLFEMRRPETGGPPSSTAVRAPLRRHPSKECSSNPAGRAFDSSRPRSSKPGLARREDGIPGSAKRFNRNFLSCSDNPPTAGFCASKPLVPTPAKPRERRNLRRISRFAQMMGYFTESPLRI